MLDGGRYWITLVLNGKTNGNKKIPKNSGNCYQGIRVNSYYKYITKKEKLQIE